MRIAVSLGALFVVAGLVALFIFVMPSKKAKVTKSRAATTQVSQSRPENVLKATTIKAIQIALNQRGSTLDVSGKLDKDTQKALRQFQRENKLRSTGRPDKITLSKLGVVSS